MRLTVEHLRRAPQFTNTMLQREIDLRGLCISVLDPSVLLKLNNDFDVINLCNNALTVLESFPTAGFSGCTTSSPPLQRINTLIVHRNKIQKVHIETCVRALPGIRYFVADRNNFSTVKDLSFLRLWSDLEVLSLQLNPVWKTNPEGFSPEEIRAFLTHVCSKKLRLIDNERVTEADRETAKTHAAKFDALLQQWTGVQPPADGRGKTRKRGRNAVATERPTSSGADYPSASSRNPADAQNANEEEERRLKLARIEERLNAEDTTPEELEQLEREMMELSRFL